MDKISTQNCFLKASKQSFAKQTSNKDPTFCFYTGFYYRLASFNHLERLHRFNRDIDSMEVLGHGKHSKLF